MELDRALELAVVSSWEDLVKPGEASAIRVEYENISDTPLNSLEVWATKKRGYGLLVCRCSVAPVNSRSGSSDDASARFANSYQSKSLADSIKFIMLNQERFKRPSGRSTHGLVQIDSPIIDDRKDAATWSESLLAGFAETAWN